MCRHCYWTPWHLSLPCWEIEQQQVAQAAKTVVELIDNANASISHVQREKVIGEHNKALLPVIGDDDNFKEATPLYFGTEFAKKGKDMIDLHTTQEMDGSLRFFRGGTCHPRGFSQTYGSPAVPIERQFHPSKGQKIHKSRTQT